MLDALYAAVHPMAAKHYHAFFSSELGGIVTDPALMVVHIDDHMVHRCGASRCVDDDGPIAYPQCTLDMKQVGRSPIHNVAIPWPDPL